MLSSVGYYETQTLFKIICENKINATNVKDIGLFTRADFSSVDIFFLESVMYEINLTYFDWKLIVNKIKNECKKEIVFLIIDTTLEGLSFNIEELLNACTFIRNIFIIEVRSLLKLSQQGLEYTNMGIVNCYIQTDRQAVMDKFSNILAKYRTTVGASISFRSAMLVNYPGFSSDISYEKKVMKNNSDFALSLAARRGEAIDKIMHPALVSAKGNAPFIFVLFKSKSKEYCLKVVQYLSEKLTSAGLRPEIGDSFGFRNCRFKFVDYISDDSTRTYILRIAVGKIRANKYYQILDAHGEISTNL